MRYRRGSSPGREAGRSRFVFLLSMFAIVASLLAPVLTLTATDAAAQGVPPDCDPGFVVSDDQTTCVPDPNQGGTETPTDVATDQAVDPTYVYIDKYDCPTDTDWSMVTDLGTFMQGCGPNQTLVTMTVNGEPQQITSSGQWGPYEGLASVPLAEEVNPNYNLPHWFCGTYASGGQPSVSDFGASASVMPNVNPGESVYCQVFNSQQPTDQYGTVTLHKVACPDATTFDDPTTATIDHLQQECQQPLANVTFDYEQNGQSVQQLVTDQSGMAQWDQAPVGQYTLREQLPSGYGSAVVHCSYHEANQGNFVGQSQPVLMDDPSSWSGTMDAGYVLDCYVFNIPSDQLQLTKHWCAPDFTAPENATEQDYQGCAEMPGAQITWRVALQANDQEITSLSPDPTTGAAGYGDLEQGQPITVLEQLPDGSGYGAPAVFCAEYQRGGNGQPTNKVSYDPTSGLQWTPQDGYFLACDFYNVPEGGFGPQAVNNSITLYKWQCDPGTMTGQPLEYYQGGQQNQATGPCETEHMDVPFTVTDANGAQPKNTVHNTTWENLVAPDQGSITMQESIPTGYGEPMVWCWYNDDDPQPMTTANGLLTLPAAPDEPWTFSCNWYNIPTGETGGNGQIVIEKYWCPPVLNFVQTPTRADMMGACQEQPTDGASFSLTGPTAAPQTWPAMQPSGGPPQSLNWADLPAGEYTITETGLGAGWTSTVYCHASNGQENATAEDQMLTGPSVTQMLAAGYTVDCAWFNQPSETTDNSISIYKWQCDPGTESGQGQEYYQGQNGDPGPCETVHGGVPVHLIDGSPDSPHDDVTSHNTPSWSGIVLDANGSFQVQMDEPAGFGTPMVFCRTLDDEQSTAVDATGGLITITPAGEPFAYQCDWYNIPSGEFQLELYKHSCDYTVDRNLGLPDLGTNPNCAPMQDVSFTASFGMTPGSARLTDANGYLNWTGVEGGPWSLTEGPMPGYAAPKVFCGPPQSGETPEVPVSDMTVSGTLDSTNPHIICYWFNFEQQTENGRITVFKFQCPPGTTTTDFGMLSESCTTPHNGIGFNLSGNGVDNSASTAGGRVDWTNLDEGTYTVTETTALPGYLAPVVYCGIVLQDGAPIDPGNVQWMNQPVTNQAIQLTLDNFPKQIVCYWYNIPSDYGEITIYKWTCPAGYDLSAWGADPKVDCKQATNGVTFTLTPPVGQALQTNTGDSIQGAVYFGGLNPGNYRVTETVPPNTQSVFVLDCTGTHLPKVHQTPLSWGNKLDINVLGGDKIVCQWYNVPRPKTGAVMVHKYVCSTKTFIDKVYCVTYERGQAFELFQVNGNASKGVGITNAGGTYTWNNLQPGAYSIREDKGVPCKMTASTVDGKGNAWVNAGQTTVINVYNCSTTPGKVPPGKPPVKYPNTGVGPDAVDNLMPANLPALQGEPASTPSAEEEAASEAFYQVDCISGSVDTGTPAPSTPAADATMPPIEAEATEAPEGVEEAPATPPATPEVSAGECERGAIPSHLSIESIGVDANIEYLEIVDGLMEQPTGASDVAWYKDTARLGESNNVVMAGHLNWWNVPEGVFYRLQDMQEGDRIEVTGEDGMVYIYEVRSVTQESNLEEPGIDVIGPTDEPTLTLITCGGDWNADIAEYNQRTVVRAVQVDVQPAPQAGS